MLCVKRGNLIKMKIKISQKGFKWKFLSSNGFFMSQIIKTQIKRFYSHEIVEYDKNADPRCKEDSEDKVVLNSLSSFPPARWH